MWLIKYKLSFIILFILTVTSVSHIAIAGVYRCADSAGYVSYSQSPCASKSTAKEMNVGNKPNSKDLSTITTEDICHEVSLMAQGIYPSIKNKKNVLHVFDDFGGLNSLTPATVNIINYVASLRYNLDLKTSRLGELSYSRCARNGFGKLTEKNLPDWKRVGINTLDPEIREQLIRNRYRAHNNNQLKDVCDKYNNMIEIYNKRLNAPMDEIEKINLEATRDMMISTRDENCKNK